MSPPPPPPGCRVVLLICHASGIRAQQPQGCLARFSVSISSCPDNPQNVIRQQIPVIIEYHAIFPVSIRAAQLPASPALRALASDPIESLATEESRAKKPRTSKSSSATPRTESEVPTPAQRDAMIGIQPIQFGVIDIESNASACQLHLGNLEFAEFLWGSV